MDKKIIFKTLKDLFVKLVNYLKLELLDELKEALLKGFEAFKETLWEEIKDEVHKCLEDLKLEIKNYFNSTGWEEKENFILDQIMSNIKLPFALKPFKGLIRKIIKSKLEDLLAKTLA